MAGKQKKERENARANANAKPKRSLRLRGLVQKKAERAQVPKPGMQDKEVQSEVVQEEDGRIGRNMAALDVAVR